MFLIGSVASKLIQTVSGWNLAGGTFYGDIDVSSNITNQATGVQFSVDGTTMFVSDANPAKIFQYGLSTPWDVTTAVYSGKYYSIAQDSILQDIFLTPDGLSLYIIGSNTDTMYQYTLTTAWDISTVVYASKFKVVSSEDTTPGSLVFKPDGTKCFVSGIASSRVYQYSLGTAWDISTASYDSKFLSYSPSPVYGAGLVFKPDGTKCYISGSYSQNVYQYSLGTAWDISTASYDSIFLDDGGRYSSILGLFFKSDGTKLYGAGTSTTAPSYPPTIGEFLTTT